MPLAEVIARIRRTIRQLALISHAGAVAFNPAPAVELDTTAVVGVGVERVSRGVRCSLPSMQP